jgi:hypothetical protein
VDPRLIAKLHLRLDLNDEKTDHTPVEREAAFGDQGLTYQTRKASEGFRSSTSSFTSTLIVARKPIQSLFQIQVSIFHISFPFPFYMIGFQRKVKRRIASKQAMSTTQVHEQKAPNPMLFDQKRNEQSEPSRSTPERFPNAERTNL